MPAPPFPNADDAHDAQRPTEGDDTTGPAADAGTPDEEPLDIVIPDDAAALDADRQAYLDEQARGIGRAQGPDWSVREPAPALPRLFQTRRWHRYGLSGPLVIAVLLAVAVVGSLMTVLRPDVSAAPTPLPLSEPAAGAVDGTVGGLMPNTLVTLDGVPLALRRLRPAVFVVVPPSCPTCADLVNEISEQARQRQLRTLVVGNPEQLDQLQSLAQGSGRSTAGVVIDGQGTLTAQYPGPGPTLILVHADGIIADVVRDPLTTARLGPSLDQLARPGAGTPTV